LSSCTIGGFWRRARLHEWMRVRLSPLGTSATNWPIVSAPDDRWWWMWSSRWNEIWQGKPKYSEKTCTSATLSTRNPTWPDLASNPDRLCGTPATNHLSYGTASFCPLLAFDRHGILITSCIIHFSWWSISQVGIFSDPLLFIMFCLQRLFASCFHNRRHFWISQVNSSHTIIISSSFLQSLAHSTV
jgi:hypothetical protein